MRYDRMNFKPIGSEAQITNATIEARLYPKGNTVVYISEATFKKQWTDEPQFFLEKLTEN